MWGSDRPSGGIARAGQHVPLSLTALFDAAAITVFVLIGRSSHHHGYAPMGVLQTLWPFVAGAAVGWSIVYVYSHVHSTDYFGREFHPYRVVPSGLVIWFCAVTVGMILRYLFHEGLAVSFIVVAAIALAFLLMGWRSIAVVLARRRRGVPTAAAVDFT
ncbi:MAG: DUF3054 domain-containing protein [Gordonia sp. (in: high G+C Gram-positive bacteria)]